MNSVIYNDFRDSNKLYPLYGLESQSMLRSEHLLQDTQHLGEAWVEEKLNHLPTNVRQRPNDVELGDEPQLEPKEHVCVEVLLVSFVQDDAG